MTKLRFSEAAALSIVEQSDYFHEKADPALALRWEASVDEAANSLLRFPYRGAPCRFRSPRLAGVRWIFVPGFPKHMLFYRIEAEADCIVVLKVAHGARDLEALLAESD